MKAARIFKKPNPKETANSMIKDRVVTEKEARQSSIDWIEEGIKKSGYPIEVIKFWKEVLKELNTKTVESSK